MNAVALVGPMIVCREPANNGATIAAMAAHRMPKIIGSPAIAANAIDCGSASIVTLAAARRSLPSLSRL